MEKSDKKTPLRIYLASELLEKLKYLHQKEGGGHKRTKKKRTFSAFISSILWEHVNERMAIIKGLRDGKEWKDEDWE